MRLARDQCRFRATFKYYRAHLSSRCRFLGCKVRSASDEGNNLSAVYAFSSHHDMPPSARPFPLETSTPHAHLNGLLVRSRHGLNYGHATVTHPLYGERRLCIRQITSRREYYEKRHNALRGWVDSFCEPACIDCTNKYVSTEWQRRHRDDESQLQAPRQR